MLRVSYFETAGGQRWNLSGRLAGAWVDELRACWKHIRQLAPRAPAVVDLSEVTFIDDAGEQLIAEMQNAGTQFIAGGVENKHLLDTLKAKHDSRVDATSPRSRRAVGGTVRGDE